MLARIKLLLFSIVCGCYLICITIETLLYVILISPEVLKEWWQDFLATYFSKENLMVSLGVLVDIYLLILFAKNLPVFLFLSVLAIWIIVGWLLVGEA